MKKFLSCLIPAVLLAACSSDEPTPAPNEGNDVNTPAASVGSLPNAEEFKTLTYGKTWAAETSCFVDAQGHTFDADILVPGTNSPSALQFSDQGCRRALEGYVGIAPYSDFAAWVYDDTDGKIIWHNHSSKKYNFYIESVSEDMMVVRTSYGILRMGFYEVVQGLTYDYLPGMDAGSYERIVFKTLDEDKAETYWSGFPERN